jgi:class 3 adenylate cyclase
MRRSLAPRPDDELKSYLPPLLRAPPASQVLLPPAHISEARGLYPIRMTLVLVALILLGTHTILFVVLGQARFAIVAAMGFISLAGAGVFLRRGAPRLALAIGFLTTFSYVTALHLTFGTAVGALLFAFPIALAGFAAYTPDEWVWRLLPTTFSVACWTVVAGRFDVTPRITLSPIEEHLLFAFHAGGSLYAVAILASHATVFRDAAERRIAAERDRADKLLLNILPESIAARLMDKPDTIADSFDDVAVLFADLVGFTALSSRLSSAELVTLLNRLFRQFDELAERHGLEKIKTIGDAYMVVGGVPEPVADPADRAARMAIDMQRAVEDYAKETGHALALRIGIHVGPVTAGVIGKNKFTYDLWGDTVNVASRMEATGSAGRIHVSDAVQKRLVPRFSFDEPRELSIKGKGSMATWFLVGEMP